MHDEDGPPDDHGAPSDGLKGNQNAVGNSGGSPPEGNTNAATHGGYCDPLKHFDRLYGDARERADELIEDYRDDYALVHDMDATEVEADEQLMNRFRALAALVHQEGWVQYELIENLNIEQTREIEVDDETRTYTTEKVNPAISALVRIAARIRTERRDLRIHGRAVDRARKERERRRKLETLAGGPGALDHDPVDDPDPDPADEDTPTADTDPVAQNATPTASPTIAADRSGEPPETSGDGTGSEAAADPDEGDENADESDPVHYHITGRVGGRYPSY